MGPTDDTKSQEEETKSSEFDKDQEEENNANASPVKFEEICSPLAVTEKVKMSVNCAPFVPFKMSVGLTA